MIDVSLLDTGVTLMEIPISHHMGTGAGPEDYYASVYKAKDGYVTIPATSRTLWTRVFIAMGRHELAEDPSILGFEADEGSKAKRLALLTEWVASNNVADITEKLVANEVPVGPVQTPAQMSRDPHLSERQMMVEVPTESGKGTIMAPGLSIKFSKTKGALGKVPAAGEHTCEILGRLPGMTAEKIEELHVRGVL